jgi:predicted transcriptional regulator
MVAKIQNVLEHVVQILANPYFHNNHLTMEEVPAPKSSVNNNHLTMEEVPAPKSSVNNNHLTMEEVPAPKSSVNNNHLTMEEVPAPKSSMDNNHLTMEEVPKPKSVKNNHLTMEYILIQNLHNHQLASYQTERIGINAAFVEQILSMELATRLTQIIVHGSVMETDNRSNRTTSLKFNILNFYKSNQINIS